MLIYNNLLCYLAAEYMDTIIYSGLFKKEFETRSTFNVLLDSKKDKRRRWDWQHYSLTREWNVNTSFN